MRIEDLVGKGYLPIEELPPAFNTKKLGTEAIHLYNHFDSFSKDDKTRNNYWNSICVRFSAPVAGFSRRNFGIPNPMHQIKLSKIISDNWSEIENIYNQSTISATIPIDDPSGDRAIKKFDSNRFIEDRALASFDKLFELKTDIEKFFPSIYTHSIPWAMHTKVRAKKNRSNSLLGNAIDTAVRNCQDGQTNGIPIGPDTSRIIAEVLGCKFDKELTDKCSVEGYRYMDDCYFYFPSYSEAERCLKHFESILTHFNLGVNEEKTMIEKLPYLYIPKWKIEISNYKIGRSDDKQREDLLNFISLAFKLKQENPNDSVLKYAIKKLNKEFSINSSNWELYHALLFKIGFSEPATLPFVLKILSDDSEGLQLDVDKDMTGTFVHEIIEEHVYKGHHFEVAWALWIAKCFNLKIEDSVAQDVFDSSDVISILIALDLKANNLIDSVNLSQLESGLIEDSLVSESWLLTYEAVKKGWLNPPDSDLLRNSDYFSELERRDIEFYDANLDLKLNEETHTHGLSA